MIASASRTFIAGLREEVAAHAALRHPFLERFAAGGLARWQVWAYASQHYRLVCGFTAYLEAIARRTPDAEVRRLVREILEEEYIRSEAHERSHPALYRRFMRAVGIAEGEWDQVPLLPATSAFIEGHLDMTLRGWLETLGGVGPGHEWAIPAMFPFLVRGIEQSLAVEPAALEYFHLHIDLDVEHGRVLEDALARWATTEEHRAAITQGARQSLELRAAFWTGVGEQVFPGA